MKDKGAKKEQLLNALFGERTIEKTAGISFSAAVLFPTLLVLVFVVFAGAFGLIKEGYETTDWFAYCNFLLPQIAYALVAVLFFYLSRLPVREVVGKPALKYFLIALLLQFGLFSLSELNAYFIKFLENFGYQSPPIPMPSLDGFGFVGVQAAIECVEQCAVRKSFSGLEVNGFVRLDFGD